MTELQLQIFEFLASVNDDEEWFTRSQIRQNVAAELPGNKFNAPLKHMVLMGDLLMSSAEGISVYQCHFENLYPDEY